MTKYEAIWRAKTDVTPNCTWDVKMNMWHQHRQTRNRSQLKIARINYAGELLGYSSEELHQMDFAGLSFRTAVYSL